jgi:hypothetical protein
MTIWQKLYQAYQEKDCEKFEELRKTLSNKDKDSLYFSYYESLRVKICSENTKK